MKFALSVSPRLRSERLVRSVRELVVAKLKDSPDDWEIYRRYRWGSLICEVVERRIAPVVSVGIVAIFAVIGGLAIAQIRQDDHFSADWLLLNLTGAVAVITCVAMSLERWRLIVLRPELIYLPLSDSRLRWEGGKVGYALAAAIPLMVGFCFANLVWYEFDHGYRIVASLAAALVSAVATGSMFMIGYAYAPLKAWRGRVLAYGGLLGIVSSLLFLNADFAESVRKIPSPRFDVWLALTPVGWTGQWTRQALLSGDRWGWLWLIPTVLVTVWGLKLLREFCGTEYIVREFQCSADGKFRMASLARGFRYVAADPNVAEQQPVFELIRDRLEKLVDDLRHGRIRSTDRFRLSDCVRGSRLQRVCGWLLTRRERTILRLWSGSYRHMKTRIVLTASGVFVMSFLAIGLRLEERPFSPGDVPLAAAMMLLGVMGARILLQQFAMTPSRPDFRMTHPWVVLPVDFRELSRIAWKYELATAVLSAPFLVGWAAFVGWLAGESILVNVVAGGVAVVFPLAFRPLFDAGKLFVTFSQANSFVRSGIRLALLAAGTVEVLLLWPSAIMFVRSWYSGEGFDTVTARTLGAVAPFVAVGLVGAMWSYLAWLAVERWYDCGGLSYHASSSLRRR